MILMKINVQMDSSSLIELYMTKVNFLYIFTCDIRFPNKSDKNMFLSFNALLECSSV